MKDYDLGKGLSAASQLVNGKDYDDDYDNKRYFSTPST